MAYRRQLPYYRDQKPQPGCQINRGHRLSDKLAAVWLMNEGGGITTTSKIYDVAGRNKHMTMTSTVPTFYPGKFGTGLKFGGAGYLTGLGSTITTAQCSVSMWVYLSTLNSFQTLFSIFTGNGDAFEVLVNSSGSVIYGGNFNSKALTAAVSTGVWMHIGCTQNAAGTVQMYVNGIKSGSTSTAAFTTFTVSAFIGARTGGSQILASGSYIDHVMCWNRCLTPEEMRQLFEQPFCMFETVNRVTRSSSFFNSFLISGD